MSTRLAYIWCLALLVAACGGRQTAPTQSGDTPENAEPEAEDPRRSAMSRGIEAAEAGRFRAAAGWFDEAIARGEDRGDALLNRSVIFAAQGRWDLAVADAQEAVNAGAGDDARLVLAGIQVRAGLVGAADAELRLLQESNTDARILRAVALSTRGQHAEAQEILRTLSADQLDATGLNTLGIVAERLGDFDAAVDFFDRAIGADDSACQPWRNLGMLLIRQGQDDPAAARALVRYLALAPEGVADRGVIEGRIARLRE